MTIESLAAAEAAAPSNKFTIPPFRPLSKFILSHSMWSTPDFNVLDQRIKTNLLYFQTNYLVFAAICFILFIIFSMRTLMTGIISAIVVLVAALFFTENLPHARQIKQDHPSVVIVAGIVLVLVTWHWLYTLLVVGGAALAPIPIWLLHASLRKSDGLLDGTMTPQYFARTPIGYLMSLAGLEPKASASELSTG